ncbi:MAG: glycosyltransferase family 4 protein [Betaproteobacteria bacterium]|nr:glycosyltransferase family 4 protein [Betaproteobacteria bacterium]
MTHYAPLIAALVTMLLTAILLYSKVGREIQDVPNERSLHDAPVPRIGGVGLMAGVLSAWALMLVSLAWWVVLPLLALFAVSLLDDMRGLPVRLRLSAHVVAAVILVFGSGIVAQSAMLALIAVLGVVWMTNLYNFMDGSDGLAGGMTLFGFTMYGFAALMHGDEIQAMLNFSIGGAALGFLYYNFYPARVFMGDAGSIPLGFLAAAMGLWGWQQGHWPAWFPLLVFFPFVADATVTLAKRTVRGAKITEAHREHYYQRLVQMGWGHRNVALLEYALMFAAGVSAIWGMRQSTEWPWYIFLMWGGIYTLLMLVLDNRWQAFQRGRHG